MSYVNATQRRNKVEVSGGVCDMVCDAKVIKTSQNHMDGFNCTVQALRCSMLSLHHMCNFTHTEASERRKRVGSDVDKCSAYLGSIIIWFKNILRVSPIGYKLGAV